MHRNRLTHAQFSRTLWRAILPPLIALAANAAVVGLLLFWMLRTGEFARRSDELVTATHEVERLLINVETGVRGYKLTGDPDFLQPSLEARRALPRAIANVRGLLQDDPRQLARVDKINQTYEQWNPADEQLDGESPRVTPQDLAIFRARKEQMDQMRRTVQELLLTEIEQRSRRYDNAARATTGAVLGSIAVTVLFGVGLALINRRTVVALSAQYQNAVEQEISRGEQLEASQRQWHDLAEAVPQLVFVVDAEDKPLYLNRRWSEFTGLSAELFAAGGWTQSVVAEDRELAQARWAGALREGKPFESEVRLTRRSDGTSRWFLCRATPVRDIVKTGGETHRRVRWFGTCTDIEAQKQIEAERERLLAAERAARSDLVRVGHVKDEFLATLSHELRTPMTAIIGWARLLRDPEIRAASLDRAIDAIDSNARSQARLIEDLLDMSRIISGKLVLRLEPLDLLQVVTAAVESVGPAATAKRVAIDVRKSGEALAVQGDTARLQQVAWNLLSNAVKFTPAGGRVTVTVGKIDDDTAELSVRDSGKGISPTFLPRVFERFVQADGSTTRQQGGLGLGLAIAKHLVELHGGEISADSEGEGKGATFAVRLPLRNELRPAGTRAATNPSPRLDGLRILAVDDDADTLLVIKTALERAGAKVVTTGAAREALRILREDSDDRFDLLLSDIGMPDMDGYGLIRRVREAETVLPNSRRIPAVALTAFARSEDQKAALDAGYDLHVSKPIAPDDLIAALARLTQALVDARD